MASQAWDGKSKGEAVLLGPRSQSHAVGVGRLWEPQGEGGDHQGDTPAAGSPGRRRRIPASLFPSHLTNIRPLTGQSCQVARKQGRLGNVVSLETKLMQRRKGLEDQQACDRHSSQLHSHCFNIFNSRSHKCCKWTCDDLFDFRVPN